MAAVIANLSQYPGEDKVYQDTIYQADGTTPQDITGWAVTFAVHPYGDPSVTLISKTVGAGITLTNPTMGVMQIQMDAADTISLPPGQFQYYVERTTTGGDTIPTAGLFTLLWK